MILSDQALEYWKVCTKYRGAASRIGRTLCANSEVPAVFMRSTHPRITSQLSLILASEGITNVQA